MPQAIVILPTGGGMQLLLCYDSKLPSALWTCCNTSALLLDRYLEHSCSGLVQIRFLHLYDLVFMSMTLT